MQYIEAPSYEQEKHLASVFLAGGITNCPDWQTELVQKLSDLNITVLNPRRAAFPIDNPDAAEEQITWEHHWLLTADVVAFWFSAGSLNPIALFELGTVLGAGGDGVIVGCDPRYERRQDVRIQTYLRRPDLDIVYSLDDLAKQIREAVAWSL